MKNSWPPARAHGLKSFGVLRSPLGPPFALPSWLLIFWVNGLQPNASTSPRRRPLLVAQRDVGPPPWGRLLFGKHGARRAWRLPWSPDERRFDPGAANPKPPGEPTLCLPGEASLHRNVGCLATPEKEREVAQGRDGNASP